MWDSPIPEQRWTGFRRRHPGAAAFATLETFEEALLNELEYGLADHELATLGRLLKRGKKMEIEVFVRTHGPNPLFNPKDELDLPVGVAKADTVDLSQPASAEANRAILDGHIVHVLFQAGEASRFQKGPLYALNPLEVARNLLKQAPEEDDGPGSKETELRSEIGEMIWRIEEAAKKLDPAVARLLLSTPLGPKQPFLIRAALRRVVRDEVASGRLPASEADARLAQALKRQKLLFFISRKGINDIHDEALRDQFGFYGFDPQNIATIEQELARGVTADEDGRLSLLEPEWARDASGHLYALIQAARPGDFTTYTDAGQPVKPREQDALAYLASRGGTCLSVIRINDMDRHSTEIVNPRALTYALQAFSKGYVNVIETVGNPEKQKGGTGLTLGDPDAHVLTETHENSFPALSRPFEAALTRYLEENHGKHPAYNAMRQWADLAATRRVLQDFGGRIVFVPRQKTVEGEERSYLGVDMPMGDLSLVGSHYRSRMFQFIGPAGRELLIHDMKTVDSLSSALRTLLRQLEDPDIRATASEIATRQAAPVETKAGPSWPYGAPAPEFE